MGCVDGISNSGLDTLRRVGTDGRVNTGLSNRSQCNANNRGCRRYRRLCSQRLVNRARCNADNSGGSLKVKEAEVQNTSR